jgi:hypothetical protein
MPRKFERTKAIRGTVSTEFEGRTYDGDFTVRDGWLEVSSLMVPRVLGIMVRRTGN